MPGPEPVVEHNSSESKGNRNWVLNSAQAMTTSSQAEATHMRVTGADGLSLHLRQWSLDGPKWS